MYPDSLQNLIESFKFFPGIGEKTAERLAFAVFDMDEEKVTFIIDSLKNIKDTIHSCPICNTLTDHDLCSICASSTRNNKILCVVEDVKSVFLFERLGSYRGLYHVLSGLISPLDGVNPEDIGIDHLLERMKKNEFEEVILAFKPSIEGETTALYIKKILEGLNITVSQIANGIPMGADMEYIDALTLERALTDRKKIS